MLKRFIERPVLSTVISVLLVILGGIGLINLPISQYPNIAPPTVNVSTNYSGANADVVLKSVIVPLEEQINGVENMTYMTSSAGNDGSASITIFFKVGTNPDLAAVNVQNRVARATSLLPQVVTQSGVTVAKSQNSNLLIFALYSENKAYDATFLQNYTKINLIPQIQRVNGVGNTQVFTSKDYAMRIWLKPDVMSRYSLIPDDVTQALNEQNIEAAPGKFGENTNESFQYVIKYKGRLKSTTEFGDIIIKSVGKGQFLHLKDVARIELGALDYSSNLKTNGLPSIYAYRANPTGLSKIFVRNSSGTMAPITEFITLTKVFGPESISRFNLFTAVAVTGLPNDGYSSGDAIKAIKAVALEKLPPGYGYDFSGLTREEISSGTQSVYIFLLCLVFVYFLLSAQYESYILPFAVLLSLPIGLSGTYLFAKIFGIDSNIYVQISLIMLIGLLSKNAILIVEFALERRRAGMDLLQSAIEGAGARLRPILMTSFAFIFGIMPLMVSTGAGAIGNKSIGTGAVGGMFLGTVLGIFAIPVLFIIFQTLQEKISSKKRHDEEEDDAIITQ